MMTTRIADVVGLRCGSYLSPQLLPVYVAIVRALGDAVALPWALHETETLSDLTEERLDLAFLCGAQYLLLDARMPSPAMLLAAPVLRGRRYAGQPWYYSDVIVRADSPVREWADLQGLRFGINEPGSHSGYAVVQERLRSAGTDWGYFERVTTTGSHLASLGAVLAGEIDAAAIDSQIWDVYRQRRRTLAKRLRSVSMLGPSMAPPIVVGRHVPASLVSRLRAALVALHEDPAMVPMLRRGGIRRFVEVTPAAYGAMRELWARNGLLP